MLKGANTPRALPRTRSPCNGMSATKTASLPDSLDRLRDDRELGGLDLERLELGSAALWILGGDRVPHDPHRGVVGHCPLRDPELPFRLPFVLPVAHRNVEGLAGKVEVDDEFSRAVAFPGCGVHGVHPEA